MTRGASLIPTRATAGGGNPPGRRPQPFPETRGCAWGPTIGRPCRRQERPAVHRSTLVLDFPGARMVPAAGRSDLLVRQ